MGIEAACTARIGRKTSAGKALLEGEVLAFVGDFKLQIPFGKIADIKADGDVLVVRTADREVRLEMGGPVAQRWARLIKEPKGLFEKLEITPQSRVAIVGISDPLFLPALREHAAGVAEERVPEGAVTILFGADVREALQKLPLLRARLVDDGTLWVVRPKASKAISEADVLAAVRGAGLVDTKVVAFSRTHTAHKCVIPLGLRGQQGRLRQPFVSLPPPPPPSPAAPSRAQATRKPTTAAARRTKPRPAPASKRSAVKTKARR